MMTTNEQSFQQLLQVMDALLGEHGCPWDKVQTHQSLKPYLIEESYEVLAAIEENDNPGLCEELGDVLFQVLFHCALAENTQSFTLEDVINGVRDKMIYRHPHVFSDTTIDTPNQVVNQWDVLKQKEKGYTSPIDPIRSIPKSFPALLRTEKVIKKALPLAPTLADTTKVWKDIHQQLQQLEAQSTTSDTMDEALFGQLLFNLITISRKYHLNSEFALTNAVETFINKLGHSDNGCTS